MKIHKFTLIIILTCFVTLLWAQEYSIDVDEAEEYVEINVTGRVKAKPDTLYIKLLATGYGSDYAGALKQCMEESANTVQAIDKLKIKHALIELDMHQLGGLNNATAFAVMSSRSGTMPPGTQVSQSITVKIKIDDNTDFESIASTISRILDAANHAGAGLYQATPPGMIIPGMTNTAIQYVLEDSDAYLTEAMADALDRANAMKDSLLRQGLKIGALVNVVYKNNDMTALPAPYNVIQQLIQQSGRGITSSNPEEVIITSVLTAKYKLLQN